MVYDRSAVIDLPSGIAPRVELTIWLMAGGLYSGAGGNAWLSYGESILMLSGYGDSGCGRNQLGRVGEPQTR
jgi:hypothetical protein